MFARKLATTGTLTFMISLAAYSVSADTVQYTDRTTFQSAASALTTEGFNTAFSAAPSVDFGDFSVNVSFGNVNSADGASFPAVVSEGARSIYAFDATQPSGIGNSIRFLFDTPINAFGIDVNDHSSLTLNATNNGSLPLTALVTGQASLFFGVIDTVPFTEVVIDWNNAGDAVGFDYLQYSAVPVPAAVWLFSSGLIGLIGTARRKKP